MRKIKKTFKNPLKINGLKKLLKKVYENRSNHLAEIAKLNLRKNIIPSLVEKIEIEINTITSKEKITIHNNNLTFLTGDKPPFIEIRNDSTTEAQYIILPWSLTLQGGRDALKNLINKISITTTSLSYTIYVENESDTSVSTDQPNNNSNQLVLSNRNNIPNTTVTSSAIVPITATTKISQPVSTSNTNVNAQVGQDLTESMDDFSWTPPEFSQDNEETLSNEISKLRSEVEEKDRTITNLREELDANKVIRLNCNAIVVNENTVAPTGSGWVIDLPAQFTCKAPKLNSISSKGMINFGGTAEICYITSQYPIYIPNVRSKIAIENVTGNIIFDIANKKLTMTGNSFGNFTTQ